MCGLFFVFAATAFAGGSPTRRTVPMLEGTKAEISLTPIAEVWLEGGFFAVQVKVDNRSEAAQSWSIQFTSERTYRQKLTFTKEINVGPRSSLETIVLVPGSGVPFASRITTLGALVVGPWVERSNLNLTNFNSNVLRQVATSASQEVALFAAISAASGGGATSGPGSSGPGGSNDQVELSVVDAAAWPADWRVWSPFTLVVMTDPEFRALDGARRAALLDWVALGGTLSLFPPFTQGSSLIPAENWGRGGIIRSEKTLAEVASPESLLPKAPKFPRQLFDQAIMAGNSSGPQAFELSSGSIGVTLFLVLFALLIGPVNLLLFAPAKSRQRLFFTVPLISLGASLVLGLVIVWRDGFGGEGVQRGLIMLLPGENKAVVVQYQLSCTGVLFSGAFPLPEDTQCIFSYEPLRTLPHLSFDTRERNFARFGTTLSGDWFASRQRQQQILQRITPTRARVELVDGGGKTGSPPVVQSSVGAPLREFRYRDSARRLWGADEVVPGRKVVLSELPSGWPDLPSGDFLARTGASELAPLPTLSSIRWNEPVFFITGRVESPKSTL